LGQPTVWSRGGGRLTDHPRGRRSGA
jgi:hypothetical protein